MTPFMWIQNLFLKHKSPIRGDQVLPMEAQIKAWSRANRIMKWGIENHEFEKFAVQLAPHLTNDDQKNGFIGSGLFYGFGDDGQGNADAVLSGKHTWEYAMRRRKTWQCEYVNFNKPEDIRLRPEAPVRPQGFYLAKITAGKRYLKWTVAQVRKKLEIDTGWGPEGFQFLSITHPHFAELMNERKLPFMALADYDVAPHGYNDFYDAPQLFCSNSKLGLGIGNVDRNYPLFGIPILRSIQELQASDI